MSFKPLLACNADLKRIKFPVWVQPKVDGVRMLRRGKVVGRSLKSFANKHVSEVFNRPNLEGLDGEVYVGEDICSSSLCRDTTSALSTIEGTPDYRWFLFDLCTPETEDLPYERRHMELMKRLWQMENDDPVAGRLIIAFNQRVDNIDQLLACDEYYLDQGYEGTIVRAMEGKYKYGRSTVREQYLLKMKHYVDRDARIVGFVEAMINNNKAQINELGYTYRTSHRENKIPACMVGAIIVHDIEADEEVRIGPGTLTHEERRYLWANPQKAVGKFCKYKFFPHGKKDKNRHPTFLTWRDKVDMEGGYSL